jgi:oligosaccharide repeat unit polymerase
MKVFDPYKESMLNTEKSIRRKKVKNNLSKIYAYFYIATFIVFLILCFEGVVDALSITDFANQRTSLYGSSDNETSATISNSFIGNACFRICIKYRVFSIFVSFSMLKDQYKKALASALLVVTSFLYYIYSSWNAARGGLLLYFICVVMIGLYYMRYLPLTTRKKIVFFSSIGVFVLVSFFISVTISRFSPDTNSKSSIFSNFCFYLGHGPIQFSKITGALKDFAWGKTVTGRLLNNYFGINYDWDLIQQEIGYPPIGPVFVTFLGYIYTDFGVASCLIFTFVWSIMVTRIIKKRPNRLSTYYIFGYYINFYVLGVFVVGRLEYVAVLSTIVIYEFLRLVEDTMMLRMGERNIVKETT